MTSVDPKTCEQLCAWMDGELPAEEARFLERRLQHDVELRAKWERLQLASACIKGQALRPMRADLSGRVMAVVMEPESAWQLRRPVWGWAIAASVAALAVLIGVQMRPGQNPSKPDVVVAAAPVVVPTAVAPPVISASPASADLVATTMTASAPAIEPDRIVKAAAAVRPSAIAPASETVALESPMPLDAPQSPTDFPLAESSAARSWPRSPLATSSDPSMEAYLVRHNEMVGDGGLGGFVPYVDVVTRERDDASAADQPQAVEDGRK